MLDSQQEIFYFVGFVSVFFIMLIAIIIVTAFLYHSKKRIHRIEVSNFKNVLIQSQLEVQEQTLQTIGADLHDNIGQLLSLTSLTLGSIDIDEPSKIEPKIESAIELTSRCIKELKQLGRLMQGEQLLEAGLIQAIKDELNWIERLGKHKVIYDYDPVGVAIVNADKDLIVFRIVQETLNNIIKHARADQIFIKLNFKTDELRLVVNDNGIGFSAIEMSDTKSGMGLYNIQKRVNVVGGHSLISSSKNEGCTIEIAIPYP
jgi:two-component system, NarL family, sensor kinase